MGLSDEQWEFLKDVAKLIEFAQARGYKLTGGELERTRYQQAEYIRTKRSRTMESNHLRKLAIDLNIFWHGEYVGGMKWVDAQNACKPLGDFWESLHPKNRWGGNFAKIVDLPHFERNV